MKTLGGHRRYPEAEIRDLVNQLRQEPTAQLSRRSVSAAGSQCCVRRVR